MAAPILLTIERHFAAPPETLFDAWLDPEAVGQWLFATPDGVMERVEIDPRVGGKFLIVERRGGELAEHFGEYLEIDRPRRLVFTFAALRDEGFTTVTVKILPEGTGSHLILVHEMDARWADYADRTRQGWTTILEGLARRLATDA